MNEDAAIRLALERHWAASGAGDQHAEDAIFSDEVICDYPQSGERIRGLANLQAQRSRRPAHLGKFTVRRITGSGSLWVTECTIEYEGKPVDVVSIMEFDGERVGHETQYFAEPFEPRAWRAQWVEPMTPT